MLAFTLVFPGWWSVLYATGALAAYTPISIFTHSAFDGGDKADLKDLFLRLIAMASTLLIANMIVRIERHRRERAVAAERASGLERERVSEEIHDGVAQNVYLLAMNLEMLAEAERDPDRAERVSSMVRLAKETLIETRGLLTNLQPVMAGTKGLPDLVRTQAEEFAAVTRIPVHVNIDGPPATFHPSPSVTSTAWSRRGWPTSTSTPAPRRPRSRSTTAPTTSSSRCGIMAAAWISWTTATAATASTTCASAPLGWVAVSSSRRWTGAAPASL